MPPPPKQWNRGYASGRIARSHNIARYSELWNPWTSAASERARLFRRRMPFMASNRPLGQIEAELHQNEAGARHVTWRHSASAVVSGFQRSASSEKRKHSFLGYFPFFGTSHRNPDVLHHLKHTPSLTFYDTIHQQAPLSRAQGRNHVFKVGGPILGLGYCTEQNTDAIPGFRALQSVT